MIGVLETLYYPQGPDQANRYQALDTQTGSAASKLTIQQPAPAAGAGNAGQKTVCFEYAVIVNTGAAAITFNVYQNTTAASTTAGSAQSLNHSLPATAQVFTASNAGISSPPYKSQTFSVPAGGTQVVDLSKFFLSPNGQDNLSIITAASFTGSVSIQWIEK